ncbi:MAG: 2-dehydropantoate 2-reductase N-terminal domain-containing protein, partial [Alphaproteobacteria bacterium]
MRIAIIGGGGVGGYLATRLMQAGHDVGVVARGANLAMLK